jgi:polysaccharide transporter, PST family
MAGMVVPLLSIPWLARALGVEAWGRVIYVQSLSSWMSAIVEYGFALSATRTLARVREDRTQCHHHSSAVLSAKLILATPCVLAYLVCVALIPILRADLSLAMAGLLLAVVQGMHPLWFFQSIERLGLVTAPDLAIRFLSLGLIVWLVTEPAHATRVLWIQVALQSGSTLWGTFQQAKFCGGLSLRWRSGLTALREGLGMFFFRASVTLYTSANGFLLGTFSNPSQVAYFGGADRIVKASQSVFSPISMAVYPRINALQEKSPDRADRLTWLAFVATQAMAWIGGLGLVLLAPWLVPLALGEGFEPAIPVLRSMVLLLPLIAASNVFGIQFLLPRRQDGAFNGIIVTAGIINCILSALIAPRWGAVGMGWTVVLSEGLVTGAMGWKVRMLLKNEAKQGGR